MQYDKTYRDSLITAADLRTGQKARVSSLGRGRGFRSKMLGMGIRPGIELKLIYGRSIGPAVLGINGRRVMVGMEMLSGIILKENKDD